MINALLQKNKAQEYCDKLDYEYDTGSWLAVEVPLKDIKSPIY